MKISIVTGNDGKYKQIVGGLPDFMNSKQIDLDIPEIQTNLLTEISADKCVQAYQKLLSACLVDDSGIYMNAFNEFPGALSKFLYKGVGLEGMQRMYAGVEDTSAVFQGRLQYQFCVVKLATGWVGAGLQG